MSEICLENVNLQYFKITIYSIGRLIFLILSNKISSFVGVSLLYYICLRIESIRSSVADMVSAHSFSCAAIFSSVPTVFDISTDVRVLPKSPLQSFGFALRHSSSLLGS